MTQDDEAAGRSAGDRSRGVRNSRTATTPLGADTQKRLGVHLRAFYGSVLEQPVPDRFKDLIAQLDASGDADATESGAA